MQSLPQSDVYFTPAMARAPTTRSSALQAPLSVPPAPLLFTSTIPVASMPPVVPVAPSAMSVAPTAPAPMPVPPVAPITAPAPAPTPAKPAAAAAAATASADKEAKPENTVGRWTAEEHNLFLRGLQDHGKGWKKIASLIKTRTVVQIRTHAQKYFQKIAKAKAQGESVPVHMDVRSSGPSPRHSAGAVGGAALGNGLVAEASNSPVASRRVGKKRGSKRKAAAAAAAAAESTSSTRTASRSRSSRAATAAAQQQQAQHQQHQQQQAQAQAHAAQVQHQPVMAANLAMVHQPMLVPPRSPASSYEPPSARFLPPLNMDHAALGTIAPPAEGSPTSVAESGLMRFPGSSGAVGKQGKASANLFCGQGNGEPAATIDYDALLSEPDAPVLAPAGTDSYLRSWPAGVQPALFEGSQRAPLSCKRRRTDDATPFEVDVDPLFDGVLDPLFDGGDLIMTALLV